MVGVRSAALAGKAGRGVKADIEVAPGIWHSKRRNGVDRWHVSIAYERAGKPWRAFGLFYSFCEAQQAVWRVQPPRTVAEHAARVRVRMAQRTRMWHR